MTDQTPSIASVGATSVTLPIPGARESNAGDAFHVLWAARRAVQLLAPHAKLRRVVMEGDPADGVAVEDDSSSASISPNTTRATTSPPQPLLSSPNSNTARATLIVAGAQAGSVPQRDDPLRANVRPPSFGDLRMFTGDSWRRHRGKICFGKLTIQLVSNQPLDDEFAATLETAQSYLNDVGVETTVTTAELLREVPTHGQSALRDLRSRSGLDSSTFTDFLRVLDLSHCGRSRAPSQRLRLTQELSRMVSTNPVANLRELCELIANEASPERANSVGLAAPDILAYLGVRNPDDLFPAPNQLMRPAPLLDTPDAASLAQALPAQTAGYLLAHGNAGVGKSTTMQALESHLPNGSVVVTFDCFGGGVIWSSGAAAHPAPSAPPTHERTGAPLRHAVPAPARS
ncbi:MAG: hypothetical protein U0841_21845 [Chloroflexia bacterium]